MNQELLDLYVDYLISSFGATTAMGLSKVLDGQVSHHQTMRMLTGKKQDSAAWWQRVKPQVRKDAKADRRLSLQHRRGQIDLL